MQQLSAAVLPERLLDLYNVEAGIDAALQGKGNKFIAEAMGVTVNHLIKLKHEHALFKEVMGRARELGLETLKDSTLTLVDENQHLAPQMVKIKADLLLWYLKVSDPVQFGDRMTIREEHIDLKGALLEAKTRVINISSSAPKVDPFED